ncbi:hypothetical protein [Aliarcobacter cryaerophilus]|uniref:hypothetical protein n=1 Tax=Aliarcobacter cryaerophilus TaxID=28198 RepID=UPI000EAE996F|nr:hypothetical protein [Aliarcobacter cryaerophilus]AYJ77276.1 hypothetical protein ACRYD_0105 [Aliarcobacter cryaerophilus D2610]AYJ78239.1 hypothetical protein ACRYD_1092 [Aliarcobacter cryaerophilus D2610]
MSQAIKLRVLEGLNLPDNRSPDIFIFHGEVIKPDESFVISRDIKGNIISRYKDNIWDLSSYSSSIKSTSLFNFEHQYLSPDYIQEAKRILFIIMLYGRGRKGSFLSINTLYGYFSMLKKLSEFCYKKSISFNTLISNEKLIYEVVIKKNITRITNLFSILLKVGSKRSGLDFKLDKKLKNDILKIERIKRNNEKQTAVIPTSIFNECLKQRWKRFNEVNSNSKLLFDFLYYYSLNRNNINSWNDIEQYIYKNKKLKVLFEQFNLTSFNSITKFITNIQGTCKNLIHSYTGMRDNEVLSLKINCIEEIIDKDTGSITKLIGNTSKYAGTKKEVKWITTKEIISVIELLNKIAKLISIRYSFNDNDLSLFISSQHLYDKNIQQKQKISFLQNKELPLDLSRLRITVNDIEELKSIDYFRDWEYEEEYKIGQIWHFKSHQYRRSLAVYAIKSGLVSLGALQVQLKHLFREMSLYYGNGASRAKELFKIDKDHIAHEINDFSAEIEAIELIRNEIFSDEELFGVAGKHIEKNIKSLIGNRVDYLIENRDKTIQMVKSGVISYKSTALGGCCSLDACNKRLIKSFVACIECDSGIIKRSKYNNVIYQQEEFIKTLPKGSIEYKNEIEDLEELKRKEKLIFGV